VTSSVLLIHYQIGGKDIRRRLPLLSSSKYGTAVAV